jgi:hypothetical protein
MRNKSGKGDFRMKGVLILRWITRMWKCELEFTSSGSSPGRTRYSVKNISASYSGRLWFRPHPSQFASIPLPSAENLQIKTPS